VWSAHIAACVGAAMRPMPCLSRLQVPGWTPLVIRACASLCLCGMSQGDMWYGHRVTCVVWSQGDMATSFSQTRNMGSSSSRVFPGIDLCHLVCWYWCCTHA